MPLNTACRSFIALLSPFVDGELSPDERRGVEQHLSVCPACSGRAADLRAQSGLVRFGLELLADEADFSDFAEKVMARVTPERPPLLERWKLSMAELFTYHRPAMISSLVTAAVAAMIAVPLALRTSAPTGYASEQMTVRSVITVPEAHVAPVVMKGENGNAIIWLVDHQHLLRSMDGIQSEQSGDGENQEAAPTPDGGKRPSLDQRRPHGGEL